MVPSRVVPAWAILLALLAVPAPAVLVSQAQPLPQAWPPRPDATFATPPDGQLTFIGSPCTSEDLAAKDLDVVVYGASGFTGRHAAFYLSSHAEKPRWAMAGRSNKIHVVHEQLGEDRTDVETIVVALSDEAGLLNMAKRAKVIISYAGPFEAAGGESLIRAALQGCAHYVDVSVETLWKAAMNAKYGPAAKARGMAIVQGAGYESMVSDFLAVSAVQDFKAETSYPPHDVKILYTTENGGLQGGQQATTSYLLYHGRVNHDPYILAGGSMVRNRVDMTVDGYNMTTYGFQKDRQVFVTQHHSAMHNCPVVRQSLVQLFPHSPISVKEGASTQMFTEFNRFKSDHYKHARAMSEEQPPATEFPAMRAAGRGPPVWVRMEGSFMSEAVATRQHKRFENVRKRVAIACKGDPSSIGTTKMSVTLALGLAQQGPKCGGGGYFTPALALGVEELERRLLAVDSGSFANITHTDIPL